MKTQGRDEERKGGGDEFFLALRVGNSKSEARNPKQIQMTKILMTETWKPSIDFAVFVLNIEKFGF